MKEIATGLCLCVWVSREQTYQSIKTNSRSKAKSEARCKAVSESEAMGACMFGCASQRVCECLFAWLEKCEFVA